MKVCPNCLNYMTVHLEQYCKYHTCACGYDDRTETVHFSSTTTRQKEEAIQFYEDNLQFKFRPDINKKNG